MIALSSLISPGLLAVSQGQEAMLESNENGGVATPSEATNYPAACSDRSLFGAYNYELNGSRAVGAMIEGRTPNAEHGGIGQPAAPGD